MTISRFLPSGWTSSCLAEIAVAQGGGTPSRSDASFWTHGTVPWVSPKDMKSRVLNSSEDLITERALAKLSLVPPQSVLIVVRSGILSRTLPVALNAVPVTINQDMRAFVPEVGVEARFVAWQLIWRESEILSACSKNGTTVASIEGPALARFPLHVAPTAEQTRIVEKLEELLSDLDAGVAELKAAQKKLALYRQSLLKAAVEGALTADWRARRAARGEPLETGAALLARILTERRARWETRQRAKFKEQGKTPPKGWQAKYPETTPPDTHDWPELPSEWIWTRVSVAGRVQLGRQRSPQFHSGENMVPYLRVANVFEERIDVSDVMAMHFSKTDEATYRLEPKDILLNEGQSLELVGRPAMYCGELERACFTNTLVRFQTESGVAPEFALLVFLHYMHSGRFRKIAKITTNIAHLGAERFSDLPFPLPPIDEQMQIVSSYASIIENVEAQRREIELSLKRATAQRKNLLMAAFSGQLVRQNPNDEPASALLARIRAEREARSNSSPNRRTRKAAHA